ncbi:MAG: DUF6273 domain-containing protein [Oscillospiraceae bacterium]|jgi:hypothetical protein|nr:DUF6273 domain-containing protein [Oscillospiraceae bacterium]
MKKLMAIILTLALVLSFTACGNGGGGGISQAEADRLQDTLDNASDNNTGSENNPIDSVSVGDVIQFGALEWRVLEIQDGMALIITEDVIDRRPYHADGGDITWEHSSLRAYLNGEFYNSFSSSEQGRIIETTIINSNNPTRGTAGGNNTTDNIFLLSIDEANNYFTDNASRIALNANGEASWWWLRSPGDSCNYAAIVYGVGNVYEGGEGGGVRVGGGNVYYNHGGVRPALWLNL